MKRLTFAISILLLAFLPACKKQQCSDLETIKIKGPSIVYLDSFFTLSVPSRDDIGYEWNYPPYMISDHETGVSSITIDPVTPERAGDYIFILHGYPCNDRTIVHQVEVRPKPFESSPCTIANNKIKMNGLGTYTINDISAELDDFYPHRYTVNADAPGASCTIILGTNEVPVYDQVWSVGTSPDYHTAEVHIRAGSPLTCDYMAVNTTGLLYVKKVSGGLEFSLCGVSFHAATSCSGFTTTADFKFVVPD